MRWRVFGAALIVAAAASVTAVTAQRPVPHLTGRVIDAESGLPVPGVTVRLSGRREFTATTNADGRYWSDALPNGMYFVSAHKDGYLGAEPQSPTGIPLRLRIRDGGALSVQQDWMLEKAARIRGRILDHYDSPLSGVTVIAAKRAGETDGWPTFAPKASAVTGADGAFEIRGLQRGPYVLAFQAEAAGATRWSFSPGIGDPRHASLVEAAIDAVQPPVVLRAAATPLARVPVQTMSEGGAPVANAAVELTPWAPFDDGDAPRPITIVTDSTGRGAFSNLPLGRHRVVARAPDSPDARAMSRGEAALDLPDQLSRGIQIRMARTQSACVFTRMEMDGAARGDLDAPPSIAISTRDQALAAERLEARVKLGEVARLAGLAPRSVLSLSAFAQQPLWALSRFSPAQPAARGVIPIDAASAGCIAAYFRRTSEQITGRIDLPDSDWAPEVVILAIPIDSESSPIAQTAMLDDGSFRMAGISMGMRYRVAAVPRDIDLFAIGASDRQTVIAAGGDAITVPLSLPIAR